MAKCGPQQIVTALVLFYVDIGGLVGFLGERTGTSEAMCWPRASVFGVLETDCLNGILAWSWFFTADLPRMMIVMPALDIVMIAAGMRNGAYGAGYLLESIQWFLYSIPLLLLVLVGIWSWRKRSVPLMAVLVFTWLVEIAPLAAKNKRRINE
jgi:hypothetical protein